MVGRHDRPRHRRTEQIGARVHGTGAERGKHEVANEFFAQVLDDAVDGAGPLGLLDQAGDRKSTRLNSSHGYISYAVFCLKKKKHRISITMDYDLSHAV